ncbi:hypothetical protein VTN31DRAFT_6048 [Thermomyces dupontii]|uniref:uncharacterized protein n=1 Tax=Talaromyces thermophilus TaxID=28565 RepID=UPI0037438457
MYSRSIKTRVKKLSKAIDQKVIVDQLMTHSGHLREIGVSGLVGRLRAEIDGLVSPDVGLGTCDPKAETYKLDIPDLHNRIQKAAPEWCELLQALLRPKHADATSQHQRTASSGVIINIISSTVYAYAPRTHDNFPVLLGVHLHSSRPDSRYRVWQKYDVPGCFHASPESVPIVLLPLNQMAKNSQTTYGE